MNKNHITDLHIENFKSIKSMDLKCKRINILVGKPNVGKSNILEALGLLSRMGTLHEVIRFNQTYELFYDNDITNNIIVESNIISSLIHSNSKNTDFEWILTDNRNLLIEILNDDSFLADLFNNKVETIKKNRDISLDEYQLTSDGSYNYRNSLRGTQTTIKKYHFKENNKFIDSSSFFLSVPFGENLLKILATNKELRKDVGTFFKDYGLDFLIDQKENKFEIQKNVDGISYKYDYSLTADTLRRVIFYIAAIKSNKDSVLLFEEPESHCFPPYISRIADEMIEAESNQFFVATHSPYLLNRIVENTKYEDCAVFVASYKDYQTHVRELTEEEISDMLDYGTDVFINYKAFVE